MLWKDGLVIKLKKFGTSGNLLSYIKNVFTFGTFQVKIANFLSHIHQRQNGTSQESIISPLLYFSLW